MLRYLQELIHCIETISDSMYGEKVVELAFKLISTILFKAMLKLLVCLLLTQSTII